MHSNGKNSKMELNGVKLAGSMQMDRKFMFMEKKTFDPRRLSALALGLYTCI